jgi:hypothetical protein
VRAGLQRVYFILFLVFLNSLLDKVSAESEFFFFFFLAQEREHLAAIKGSELDGFRSWTAVIK